jgi:hypothetical protein
MPDSSPDIPKDRGLARLRNSFARLWNLFTNFAEPLIAVTIAFVFGVLGIIGTVKGDALAGATLLVLAVVAGSLIVERNLRLGANRNIDGLGRRIDETTDAVNAIQSGNPYTVLSHETTWDIVESDGSLVHATRVKDIRIDQNNVFALYDFHIGDGEREIKYSPGERVSKFIGHGGKMYDLINLGRLYYRGERLTFTVERTVRSGFMEDREAVAVDTRDPTERMHLKIIWPADRPPRALRLGRGTASHEWKNEDVLRNVKKDGERQVYEVELTPEKGGTTTIEWEWDKLDPPPPPADYDASAAAAAPA